MDIPCSAEEQQLFEKISQVAAETNTPCYVVGGFVRDKLLQRPTKDIDFVCLGSGINMAQAVAGALPGRPTVNFFKNFGTAQFRHKDFEIEFVGARKESYNRDSRKPLVEEGTLDDDQKRRDFTINAMAVSLNPGDYGKLLDPFSGMEDLEQKIIRTPLDPDVTFSDDPLRMMRCIRFATQLNFTIDSSTFDAIGRNKERIKIISYERITDELNKIILAPRPSVGFDLLFRSGLLDVFFPQLVALAGAEYIDGKGHKDNFYHT